MLLLRFSIVICLIIAVLMALSMTNSMDTGPTDCTNIETNKDYHKYTIVREGQDMNSSLLHCNNPQWAIFEVSKNLTAQNQIGEKLLYRVCLDKRTMRTKYAMRIATETSPVWSYTSRDGSTWGYGGLGGDYNGARLCNGYFQRSQKGITSRYYGYFGGKEFPYYFNRGHLVAFADFSDPIEQRTTYLYINVAPQWDTFNAKSWEQIERESRSMLNFNPWEWEIYTGVSGMITNSGPPLYLADNALPVPKIFWKIVYNTRNPSMSKAFIGVNDPLIVSRTSMDASHRLCLNPKSKSEGMGFTHECPVDEFLQNLNNEEKIVKKT